MIARIWQAITLTSEADCYAEYLDTKVLPGYRKAKGNEGIFALRSTQGEITYFLLFSLWSSHEDLHEFTDAEEGKIRMPAEERRYLLAFESIVKHYDVICDRE